ncbi:hypothetical protein RHGRI_020890 [Rhododendron griersonianum]|uniref:Uncharacterized protein n=1 Tax=Rhododendron griersonianum TaxID=479676 RepID=A0AAV6JI22_9ERIC|nr:hypothetical protein RHGRI_020890 [Rhododendron griersonianum]
MNSRNCFPDGFEHSSAAAAEVHCSRWASSRRSKEAGTTMATAGGEEREIDARVRLMNLANEGDLEGMKELLDSGTDVNYRDINGRTVLHVAACRG